MRADDRASLATRQKKDKSATPEQLRQRWAAEAAAVGLRLGRAVDDLVIGRQLQRLAPPSDREIFAALVDPATGLCATESRFCEAHVVERVAALSGGRLRLDDIVGSGSWRRSWSSGSYPMSPAASPRSGPPSNSGPSKIACSRASTT
jgi:hypothetical protein